MAGIAGARAHRTKLAIPIQLFLETGFLVRVGLGHIPIIPFLRTYDTVAGREYHRAHADAQVKLMETTLKKAPRQYKNPLYRNEKLHHLASGQQMQEIKKLLSRKKLRLPAPTAEILPLQSRLRPFLKRAWPSGSDKDISWMTADLAALWEVSRTHITLVKNLLKMGRKPSRAKLRQISIDLDINWSSNAPAHMQTLRRELAKFRRTLCETGRVSKSKE